MTYVLSSLRQLAPAKPMWVAIFAGTGADVLPMYEQAAGEVGALLIEQQVGLLIEGVGGPLLQAVATPFLSAGAPVVQVGVADELRTYALPGAERCAVADRASARRLLLSRADAVLVLPGGVESCAAVLDGLLGLLADLPRTPLGLLTTGAFFLPLVNLLIHLGASGFLAEEWHQFLFWEPRPRALLARVLHDPAWLVADAVRPRVREEEVL